MIREATSVVPTEILSKIFRQALPRQLDQEGRLDFQTIRSVCTRWRSVSFSSPSLWSSLSVAFKEEEDPDFSHLPRLEGWFSRSGSPVPLELAYENPNLLEDFMKPFMSLIQRHQTRWIYLWLDVDTTCFWEIILSAPSTEWTNLHTLRLWAFDGGILCPESTSRAFNTLQDMQSLKSLLLRDEYGHRYTRSFGPTDLRQLEIIFNRYFGSSHVKLLSGYSSLRTLILNATMVRELGPMSSKDHCTLPTLSSLICMDNAPTFFMLKHFTTPALVALEIEFPLRHGGEAEGEVLQEFLARCTSALKSITIDGYLTVPSVANLLPILSTQPSITHLTLSGWPPISVTPFSQNVDQDWCPNLQVLTVGSRYKDEFELEQMTDLATFLRRRENLGLTELQELIIRRIPRAIDFPYGVFEGIRLGRICVILE
ncbi:hypothetical protein BKA70DRAFT_1334707 [Coprinopsis sp. MPI-PUGE-AT-0042]|nr:hypothetical protein BKA70DRAFT_1334707 [Coprinopsis sp. MPI-PUGE-AT-0042]